jgi:4-hydroxybenzoate polyprenyltransferase
LLFDSSDNKLANSLTFPLITSMKTFNRSRRLKNIPMSQNFVHSLRISHWYKNLLAFLGLLFEREILNLSLVLHVSIVFLLLCLISTSNYIINDIVDKNKDMINKIKVQSFFAKIDARISTCIALLIIAASVAIGLWFVPEIIIFILFISILGQLYNIYAKNVPVLDVVFLLLIYILRIYSGYISLKVIPSSLIVLPIAMLALFLIFIKKRSTLLILGEKKAVEFRKCYAFYTKRRIEITIRFSGIGLVLLYLLYVSINEKFNKITLLFTLPVVFILIFNVAIITRNQPEFGIFLFKTLKRRLVLACSIYIVVLYLADIIFF